MEDALPEASVQKWGLFARVHADDQRDVFFLELGQQCVVYVDMEEFGSNMKSSRAGIRREMLGESSDILAASQDWPTQTVSSQPCLCCEVHR